MTFIDLDLVVTARQAVLELLNELEIKKTYTIELKSRYKAVLHQADVVLTEWMAHRDSQKEEEDWGKLFVEDDDPDEDTSETYVEDLESNIEQVLPKDSLEFASASSTSSVTRSKNAKKIFGTANCPSGQFFYCQGP